MTTDAQKNDLLEQFQNYLEQSRLDEENSQPAAVDLAMLLGEMATLKTEVKAESRQFKNTLDTLGSSLDTLQNDNAALAKELTRHDDRLRQQQQEITRTMLLEFVDIYDRLTAGLHILQGYCPVKKLFKRSRDKDIHFIQRFHEGQQMTLNRFERLLLNYHIRPIDCVGKALDPHTMTAIATGHDPEFGNGVVLEELRKGFLFHDQVLRLAEVKVNKIQSPVTSL
ncbi:nucleotide exchange factor GrpE [Methylomarinum vadi]|uniref:nucleotide exchange factor GrpE n=1 Tax=Methylomarinum vadi TaxID=438855 RepID=UPI0004DF2E72|nr:nucleotide exchange factor GrpE [Methylomarinum vadi]